MEETLTIASRAVRSLRLTSASFHDSSSNPPTSLLQPLKLLAMLKARFGTRSEFWRSTAARTVHCTVESSASRRPRSKRAVILG